MSAKQFQHFLSLQQQLAGLRRPARVATKPAARPGRVSTSAVTQAKDWLAEVARGR